MAGLTPLETLPAQLLRLHTTHPLLTAFLALLAVPYVYYLLTRDPRRKHLPPQPPGLPILNQTLTHMIIEGGIPPDLKTPCADHGQGAHRI